MRDFDKEMAGKPIGGLRSRAVRVRVCSFDADHYLNVVSADAGCTLVPSEARWLRDALIEAYPLEQAPKTYPEASKLQPLDAAGKFFSLKVPNGFLFIRADGGEPYFVRD